jgi:hypothetical protein
MLLKNSRSCLIENRLKKTGVGKFPQIMLHGFILGRVAFLDAQIK